MHWLLMAEAADAVDADAVSVSTSHAFYASVGEIALLLVLIGVSLAILPRAERRQALQPIVLLLLAGLLLVFSYVFSNIGMGEIFGFAADLLLFAAVARTCFLVVIAVLQKALSWRPQKIYLDLSMAAVYAMVLIPVLRKTGIQASQILTWSAVLTGVLAVVWQGTLTNIFAGIALHIHNPFNINDWIQFDDKREHIGKVKEISWRATTVETLDKIEVVVPNAKLADAFLTNFMRPYGYSRRSIYFVCPYDVPPARVQAIVLKAIEGAQGVLTSPSPTIVTNDFTERGVQYWLRYFIEQLEIRDGIDGGVRNRIWYSLSREGIAMPPSVHQVALSQALGDSDEEITQRRVALNEKILHANSLCRGLPDKAFETLAHESHTHRYSPNEIIIRQGEPGTELFLISAGTVRVSMSQDDHVAIDVGDLGPGAFFGEMSLLTGGPRRSTVKAITDCQVLVIGKHCFATAFAESPEIMETISEIIATRQIELDSKSQEKLPAGIQHEKAVNLVAKIREYFGIP